MRLFSFGVSSFSLFLVLSHPCFGAFTSAAQWELRATGSDSNGGGFDAGVAGFPTDGAATSANTASPVFSSASYSFVSGDVGARIYIASGSNWTPGYYTIASVAGGSATLTAGVGTATLSINGVAVSLNTAAGMATTASPTGATWGVDYSQANSARIAFTDMVIGGTNTQFTSAANPVGKNFVGNIIDVTSGTGFTVQRIAVVSTSGTTATCDKAIGTAASTGGVGNMGGGFLTPGVAAGIATNANQIWVKTGTYAITSTITVASLSGTRPYQQWIGYSSLHSDNGTAPTITTSTNSTILFSVPGNTQMAMANLVMSNTAATRADGIRATSTFPSVFMINCRMSGFAIGINGNNGSGTGEFSIVVISNTEITGTTTAAIENVFGIAVYGSYIHDNTIDGIQIQGNNQGVITSRTIFSNNGRYALNPTAIGNFFSVTDCSFFNNGQTFTGHPFALIGGTASGIFANNLSYGGGTQYLSLNMIAVGASNASDSAGMFPTSGSLVGFYETQGDVALTANPFVNSASNNYALNSTAGGGAGLKQTGIPGTFQGGATQGFPDIGAVQAQGSTTVVVASPIVIQ